jgi:alkylation response protein AidB-like acyl-CoA dehydrogenase
LQQRAKLRVAATHAATASAQAVDLAYLTGGGSSIYETSLLQRCFRDAHAVTQHVGVAPDTLEDVGRVLFGLQPKMIIF